LSETIIVNSTIDLAHQLDLRAVADNCAQLPHPLPLWLGDVVPVPGPLPNVLSAGDLIVFAGLMVLLQPTSRLVDLHEPAQPVAAQRLPGVHS
jgi:hypothetical protein